MSYPSFTAQEFRDNLREYAKSLANGEREVITIPLDLFDHCEDDADFKRKMTPQYLRSTAIREVEHLGRISIKRVKDDDRGVDAYEIRFIKGVKESKAINSDALPKLEATWRKKFIKHLLATQPRITDLKGEQLEGAAIALERFAAMLNEMMEGE